MEHFQPDELKRLVARIAVAADVPPEDAEILSDSLVWADCSGASTHGVSRLNIYVQRIRKGLINPRAKLSVERRKFGVFAADAGNGLGQVQTSKVIDHLIPVARWQGLSAATIRNSQHFGTLGYYCDRAAAAGMILLAMTNCEPAMSPHGGCQAYFGTNPIAASFPTGKGYSIKIDLATSIVARGNIIKAQKLGQPIAPGLAIDPDGNPTTDPDAALQGTILAMAGHKGYALALMVEALCGVLSGSAFGSAVGSMYKQMDRPQGVGHFLCLLDISAFMDLHQFIARVDCMIDQIKTCRKRGGVDEILVPGERSVRCRARAAAHGVTLDKATMAELNRLCGHLGVPWPEAASPAASL